MGKKTKKKGACDEQICRRTFGKRKCKNVRSDNKFQYCEKHYKDYADFCSKRRLTRKNVTERFKRKKVILDEIGGIQPPTTDIECGSANVGTKRKNVERIKGSRELGFTDLLTENPTLITSNKLKKKKLPPDEQYCCKTNGKGWRCKNIRMGHGGCDDDSTVPKTRYCEKHYILRQKYYENLKKRSRDGEGAGIGHIEETRGSGRRKKVVEEDDGTEIQNLGATNHDNTSDMECGSGNVGTKRKNVERTQGSRELDFTDSLTENPSFITLNKLRKKEMEKKTLLPDEQYCCQTAGKAWRCKNFRMGHGAAGDDASVPKTKYCEKHYNSQARYRKKFLQKRNGDSGGIDAGCSTATGPVEIRRSKRRKTATEEDETGEIQPATIDNTCSAKIGTKRKIGEPVVDLESLEHYKSKCFELAVELEKQKVELEKKNVEYTILQGKYAELETKKTAAEDEDAVKYWRNKCSDLESLVLRMGIENPTMRCGVSHVSNLESLVTRNGKEGSILRCEELPNSEKIESEVQGLQNESTETGENQRYKDNKSTLNTETSSGGREDSRVNKHHKSESEFPKYSALNISSGSLHLASGCENVEEAKGLGCSEGTPIQHGSSSQAHLEMSKKNFVNLISDSDDESVDSLGDPMDMLATVNKHEMKWKSEVDMLSSFEEDPEICLKAVCALYRQEISEDEISPKGLVIDSDTLRCTSLAQFLMDNDCKGDVKKSVKELEKFDSKAVGDCKKLVRRYSIYLFDIYENRKDPFFLPATTASNGDETAK
ncbi:hypothetical protein MKX03_002468 [Papaver bracteatum]|nr:hypothetical protein MKX03_002468 [Papaver bracteatum]